MTAPVDLKQLERQSFRTTFIDGLWEVMLGLVFFSLSLMPWLDTSLGLPRGIAYLIFLVSLAPIIGGVYLVKKRIVLPRMGLVHFHAKRRSRLRQLRLALLVTVLFSLLLMVLTATGVMATLLPASDTLSGYLVGAAIFVIGFGLLAFFLDYGRLYLYGWLLAFEYPLSEWMAAQWGLVFPNGMTLVGGFITAVGLIMFIRFWHHYPVPSPE